MQTPTESISTGWPFSSDILRMIFNYLTREQLYLIALVSRQSNVIARSVRVNMSPHECCRVINEAREQWRRNPLREKLLASQMAPPAEATITIGQTLALPPAQAPMLAVVAPNTNETVTVEKLKEFWTGTDNEFLLLCNVRSFDYLSHTVNNNPNREIIAIINRTISVDWKESFFRNPYLFDLVLLALLNMLEIYSSPKARSTLLQLTVKLINLERNNRFNNKSPSSIENFADPSRVWLELRILSAIEMKGQNHNIQNMVKMHLLGSLTPEVKKVLLERGILRGEDNINDYEFFTTVSLLLFIDQKRILSMVPKIFYFPVIKRPLTKKLKYLQRLKQVSERKVERFDVNIILRLAKMGQQRRDLLFTLSNQAIALLFINTPNKRFGPQMFFKQCDALSDSAQTDLYKNAIIYLSAHKEKAEAIADLDRILMMPIDLLQDRIKQALTAPRKNKKTWQSLAPICLLLLLNSQIPHINREVLISVLFEKESAQTKKVVELFYTLSNAAIDLFVNPETSAQFKDYISQCTVPQLKKIIKMLLEYFDLRFLVALQKGFVAIPDIEVLEPNKKALFMVLLSCVSEVDFSLEIQRFLRVLREEVNYVYYHTHKEFFSEFSQNRKPHLTELIKLVQSPLLTLIIKTPAYVQLLNSIGIEKLAYCVTHVKVDGMLFYQYITAMHSNDPAKFSSFLPVIARIFANNQEYNLISLMRSHFGSEIAATEAVPAPVSVAASNPATVAVPMRVSSPAPTLDTVPTAVPVSIPAVASVPIPVPKPAPLPTPIPLPTISLGRNKRPYLQADLNTDPLKALEEMMTEARTDPELCEALLAAGASCLGKREKLGDASEYADKIAASPYQTAFRKGR